MRFSVDNSSVGPICHHLREIRNRHVHDLDLALYNRSILNIIIPMEKPYATLHLSAVAMIVISVTVCEILTVEMYMNLTMTPRMDQSQM